MKKILLAILAFSLLVGINSCSKNEGNKKSLICSTIVDGNSACGTWKRISKFNGIGDVYNLNTAEIAVTDTILWTFDGSSLTTLQNSGDPVDCIFNVSNNTLVVPCFGPDSTIKIGIVNNNLVTLFTDSTAYVMSKVN